MTGLTQELARYVQEPDFGPQAEQACDIARMGMIDTIATALAGAHEPVARIALDYAGEQGGNAAAAAPLWFAARDLPARQSAFVNGTASHALDYDDVALSGHPSTALTPAILAQGHVLGASGERCVRAYVVGYETWAELVSRETDPYHIKGWHPTAVFGTVAATAALAYLRGTQAPVAAHALGIAASLASGLVANFGTMTKPLHAGRAGALAFEALDLAERGLTAAPDALEHKAGFLNALSPQGRVDRERPAALQGQARIATLGLAIKKYPVCYSGHRIIDGLIALADTHGIDPQQVERVRVAIGRPQASMLRNRRPATALQAKFSAEFAVASALLRRKVGLAELQDEVVNQPAMRALYDKVEVALIEQADPSDSAFALYDEVRIEMRDGTVLESGRIPYARGHARQPLTEDELRAKFDECLRCWQAGMRQQAAEGGTDALAAGHGVDAQDLYGRLRALRQLPDVRALFRP
ncbi:MmgE/PrpD family protein [Orrella sp. JC864]|uniref:MmgE/PrpD family protein n=1 Tax=Orrella sp. JC864 TaxID=3120298 RepID=UPI0030085370